MSNKYCPKVRMMRECTGCHQTAPCVNQSVQSLGRVVLGWFCQVCHERIGMVWPQ
jgi:cytochrome c5